MREPAELLLPPKTSWDSTLNSFVIGIFYQRILDSLRYYCAFLYTDSLVIMGVSNKHLGVSRHTVRMSVAELFRLKISSN